MSKIPLNELVTLQRGFDLPKEKRVDGTIPVVASTGIVGFHNEAKVKANGVVIGRSGSIGGGQYITEDFFPLNTTLYVKDFKGHHPRFIYYLFRSIDFSQFNAGTGVPTLNRNHLSSLLVNAFDIDTEQEIANILGTLDDKVQLNTQINQTLEQIAQAIFKSWFIDFDPVKAKAEAKAQGSTDEQANIATMGVISGKSPDQLNAYKQTNPTDYQQLHQLAQAFPSEFEEIDGVEVPKGWGRVSIADKKVLEIIKPRIDIFDGEKEYIATANVSGNSIVGDLELISYENRPSRANMQPVVDSIWFAKMVGEHKAILIDKNDSFLINRTILSTGFMGLKPKENRKCFLYCYINSEQFKQEKNQLATGAVQIALNNGSFSKIQITLPVDNVLAFFENKLSDIFSQISENHKENKVLANTRDLLLPKLLNGEVGV